MVFCPRDGQRLEHISQPGAIQFFMKSAPSGDIAVSTDSDPLIGRTIADHYKLVAKIGQGGMGVVYKAEHVRITRPSAIKILNPEFSGNPEFVARFGREAELASRINHPNAVGIYDVGEDADGLVYIAMEFVDGELLSKILKREGPLPLDRVVTITRQVADALDAAHELDIVHRDMKPDNIMICKRKGKCDWVKVVDFGIAKRAHHGVGYQNLTKRGLVLGTPEYMAPEQLLREPLDIRSDIYSLGLVVYKMLSGKLPFEGPTPQSRMIKKLTEPPINLKIVRPQLRVSPQVEAVIMKALATDRKNRYSSSIEFATALERAAESNAVYTVLAGDDEKSWGDSDEADTQASEGPMNLPSANALYIEDEVKNAQSPISYQVQTISPPPQPAQQKGDRVPVTYDANEGSLGNTARPASPATPPSPEPQPQFRQLAVTERAHPRFEAPTEPQRVHPPVYEQRRDLYPQSPQPVAPPGYDQRFHAVVETRTEKSFFDPLVLKSINWKVYAAVILLVVIVIVMLLVMAMWLSGSGLLPTRGA
jgi:serine/threonine-protein kinase